MSKERMIEFIIEKCRSLGMRRTRALEALLKKLAKSVHPVTLEELSSARSLKNLCDKTTVYRLLQKLNAHGIVRRLGLHERSAYYVLLSPGEHHDYLICTECGSIEALDIVCPVEKLEKQVQKKSGYGGIYHELEFFGICPDCG